MAPRVDGVGQDARARVGERQVKDSTNVVSQGDFGAFHVVLSDDRPGSAQLLKLSGRLSYHQERSTKIGSPVYETTTDAEISDKVLWAAVHGSASPPPPPGPNASPAEHERAVLVWSMLSAHESVRALLAKSGDG